MQLGSMFISNCNNTLHVSDDICVHPQEHLKTVVTASGVWHAARYKVNINMCIYRLYWSYRVRVTFLFLSSQLYFHFILFIIFIYLLPLLSPVALLFPYYFFRSLCCSFFYFPTPFFRFVCFSLPHFSSFHQLLFISPLVVYFCFLTSRRLDSVSHADCDCMFSGMWRRVVLYTSTNASDESAISIFRVYKQSDSLTVRQSIQKVQAECLSARSATMYQETRRHIQEDLDCINTPMRISSLVNRTFSHSRSHRVSPTRASWPDKVVRTFCRLLDHNSEVRLADS
jgi:hypothetical protein